jgi:branched-chain amino acid transport system ATP-binding protein
MRLRERLRNFRPSVATGGAAIFPLVVLFGLNGMDEFDREAFNILLPDIRKSFGLSFQGILTLTSVAGIAILLLELPIAFYADRLRRTRMAAGGTAIFSFFSLLTGLATGVPMMAVARVGTGLGRATERPLHRALLADYYDIPARPAVYAFHGAANNVGQFIGPLAAGGLAYLLGWRAPFIIFAIPTFVFVVLALRLKDPVRGAHERRVMGVSEETAQTEEAPPSFSESWRIAWQVKTLRRLWIALPIISIPTVATRPLLNLFYEQELHLNTAQRGVLAAINEPFQLVGLFIGIPIAAKLIRRDPGLISNFIAVILSVGTVLQMLMVFARSVPIAVVNGIVTAAALACLAPVLATTFSLLIPPRIRSFGFSVGGLFALPALFFAPIVGRIADSYSLRTALLLFLPMQFIGVFMISSSGRFAAADIHRVRTATVAMSEVRAARRRGEVKLLLVKDLDVSYDQVQVLFGVDFEIDEGEIVALLGTNGAGKSTLLKAISGLVEAGAGAVVFDGQDVTYAPPNEVARRGISQVPGGRGIFPSLTVAENLKIAGWMFRRDPDHVRSATAKVLEYFPALRERIEQQAGNLSGGEQQMLTLAMAFIAKPKLLMIDELSLGLAPVIVDQLLTIVRAIRDQGTTIILVEQSVNVALTLAQTAYFMEKGEIRFHGPTRELLERPDILRSVFLEGAGSLTSADASGNGSPSRQLARARPRAELAVAADQPPALEVRGLSKSFGGVNAVTDVDISLRSGEILGVIGPNGAGKTTIFDLVSGFLTADAGRILYLGEDVTTYPAELRARRGLGRSFQDAKLFPALTVRDTIALALARTVKVKDPIASALNLPAVADSERQITARVDELIELMGLEAFRDKFVSELSTGSRRIVDLACVLAHDPKVLLFDEPSSGIAQRETEELGPLLLRIREVTGSSLLVIEHDMPLVTSISDEMIALDLGRVVTRGAPQEVINHPTVVASYLGTSEETIARSGSIAPAKKPTRRKQLASDRGVRGGGASPS